MERGTLKPWPLTWVPPGGTKGVRVGQPEVGMVDWPECDSDPELVFEKTARTLAWHRRDGGSWVRETLK